MWRTCPWPILTFWSTWRSQSPNSHTRTKSSRSLRRRTTRTKTRSSFWEWTRDSKIPSPRANCSARWSSPHRNSPNSSSANSRNLKSTLCSSPSYRRWCPFKLRTNTRRVSTNNLSSTTPIAITISSIMCIKAPWINSTGSSITWPILNSSCPNCTLHSRDTAISKLKALTSTNSRDNSSGRVTSVSSTSPKSQTHSLPATGRASSPNPPWWMDPVSKCTLCWKTINKPSRDVSKLNWETSTKSRCIIQSWLPNLIWSVSLCKRKSSQIITVANSHITTTSGHGLRCAHCPQRHVKLNPRILSSTQKWRTPTSSTPSRKHFHWVKASLSSSNTLSSTPWSCPVSACANECSSKSTTRKCWKKSIRTSFRRLPLTILRNSEIIPPGTTSITWTITTSKENANSGGTTSRKPSDKMENCSCGNLKWQANSSAPLTVWVWPWCKATWPHTQSSRRR